MKMRILIIDFAKIVLNCNKETRLRAHETVETTGGVQRKEKESLFFMVGSQQTMLKNKSPRSESTHLMEEEIAILPLGKRKGKREN